MERQIGDPGEFLNNSFASRAVNIEPDMRKVRQLDIYHRRYRNLLRGFGLAGLVLLAGGGALWRAGHPVWGSVLGIVALPLLYLATTFLQTLKGDAYRNGLLIPGIVSQLQPLTITCLADVRTSSDDDFEEDAEEAQGNASAAAPARVLWGVKQVVVQQLTMHSAQLGEQVPCVSLFGGEDENGAFYTAFEPRPLAWGTADARVIEQARRAIDEEEWDLLPPLTAAYAASEKNDSDIAYFDAALRPVRVAQPAAGANRKSEEREE